MRYGYLTNPNVGVITEPLEPFHHAIHFTQDDPLLEDYETNRGVIRCRVRQDARQWLNENQPLTHRVYPDHRMIVFRSSNDAMLFKLAFG